MNVEPSATVGATAQATATMTLREHLSELRQRLSIVAVAFVIATVLGFSFSKQALDIFLSPAIRVINATPSVELVYASVTEGLLLQLRLAAYVGAIFIAPLLLYQVVSFVSPGLTTLERSYLKRVLPVGVLLFLIGSSAAYMLFLPFALSFFFGYAGVDIGMIVPASQLLSFVLRFILPFGLVFELPLFAWLLAAMGLLQPAFLRQNRKYSILIIAVASAVLTPPDLISMIAMGVPMLLLFELSILVTALTVRRRQT